MKNALPKWIFDSKQGFYKINLGPSRSPISIFIIEHPVIFPEDKPGTFYLEVNGVEQTNAVYNSIEEAKLASIGVVRKVFNQYLEDLKSTLKDIVLPK